jgi:enolase
MEVGVDVYNSLKKNLKDEGYSTGLGDEGGFAPSGLTPSLALELIKGTVSQKYRSGEDVFFGMDVAAESFHSNGSYTVEEGKVLSKKELMDYYADLLQKYEVIYLEDPYYEKDEEGWSMFYKEHSQKLMVVGDDLVVTNPLYLKKAIDGKWANAVIVKPNQVGTLSETVKFIKMAQQEKMHIILSHRSGESGEDTFISDLAVGVNADFIKSGAPARGERVVKYNRLLEIFHELK